MRGGDEKEVGLTPGQQIFLMGKVAALEEALHAVALHLPCDAQSQLRSAALIARDSHQAKATIPAPFRTGFETARYQTFDRLMRVLSAQPDNDNEER